MIASATALNRKRVRLSRHALYNSITIGPVRTPKGRASRSALHGLEKDFAQADRNDIYRDRIDAPSPCGDGLGVTAHQHRKLPFSAPNAPDTRHAELVDRRVRGETEGHAAVVPLQLVE